MRRYVKDYASLASPAIDRLPAARREVGVRMVPHHEVYATRLEPFVHFRYLVVEQRAFARDKLANLKDRIRRVGL